MSSRESGDGGRGLERVGAAAEPRARTVEEQFALEVYPKRDITIVKGRGAEVWDDRGRRYIDCVAGIGVASVGHANPAVAKALAEQARTLVTCPGIFYNDVRARLLEKLAAIAPGDLSRGFLCNSGAESIEAAIKFARLTTGRTGIVSAMRGFHGRTLGALSATHKNDYRDAFKPLVPGFSFVPFNNPGKLRDAVGEDTAAVLIEPVQGEGGIRPATAEFLQVAREACDETGALLVFDEIQTGFCRTGRMFACEHYGVVPDVLCLAKAIAGGVPLGAVLADDRIQLPPGKHGTTYGGNPLACAAALATIGFMQEEGLAERAEVLGARFRERFEAAMPDRVRVLRQVGLMIGIELKERCRPHIMALGAEGVLTLPAGTTVIRVLPPLVITEGQIDEVVEVMVQVLNRDVTAMPDAVQADLPSGLNPALRRAQARSIGEERSVFQPGHDHERAGGEGLRLGGVMVRGGWRLGWWGGGGGGARAASPEASGASRGAGGAGHAAGFSALAMRWKSALRARWTSWPALRLSTACAAASICSKVMPGFRKPSAPGSDPSFSYGVMTSSWGYFLRRCPFASSTSTAKRQVR